MVLFTPDFADHATSLTLLMAGFLSFTTLVKSGGEHNLSNATKILKWIIENVEEAFKNQMEINAAANQDASSGGSTNSSPKHRKRVKEHAKEEMERKINPTSPPVFFNVALLEPEFCRAIKITCLLVYAQLFITLKNRAEAMVAILDAFTIAYREREDGWGNEVHEK